MKSLVKDNTNRVEPNPANLSKEPPQYPPRVPFLERMTAINVTKKCVVEGCDNQRTTVAHHCVKHAKRITRYGHPLASPKTKGFNWDFEEKIVNDILDLNWGSKSVQLAKGKVEALLRTVLTVGCPTSIPQLHIFQKVAERWQGGHVTAREILKDISIWILIDAWQGVGHGAFVKSPRHLQVLKGDVWFKHSGTLVKEVPRSASNRTAIADFIDKELGAFFGAMLKGANTRKKVVLGEYDALADDLVAN